MMMTYIIDDEILTKDKVNNKKTKTPSTLRSDYVRISTRMDLVD